MGDLILYEEWMGAGVGRKWGKWEEGRKGELGYVCKIKKGLFKKSKERKRNEGRG